MIHVLTEDTIQKIAAGEVVEKPVSIVKEATENSIDAGADMIIVEIKNGGKSFIRISDNGSGISSDEVEKAFLRHSTSKLKSFNDLYSIQSLGFRGEALASIINVAKVKMNTKTEGESVGTTVIYRDGKLENKGSVGMNKGTISEISDLFANIPVRKKFLKSDIAESNSITNMMYRFAVGNPNVGIKYIKDDKIIFETKANNSIKDNLISLFGKEISNNLLELNIKKIDYKIFGYITNGNYYRGNRNMEYLFVNGRYVESGEIRASIEQRYKAIIPNGRFPSYQLFLEINPALIDVNIHPNKQKISISIIDEIIESLSSGIQEALKRKNNFPKFDYGKEEVVNTLYEEEKSNYSKPCLIDVLSPIKKEFIKEDNIISEIESSPRKEINDAIYQPNTSLPFHIDSGYSDSVCENTEEIKYRVEEIDLFEDFEENDDFGFAQRLIYIGKIFNTYLVFQDGKTNTVYIFDQHAAHERILYEKFLFDWKNKSISSQILMTPYVINIDEVNISTFNKYIDNFKTLGFEIDDFGDESYIIRAVPIVSGIEIPVGYIMDTVDLINEYGQSELEDIDNILISRACKAAIKAGDKIHEVQANDLIKQLFQTEYPYTCPHGRPVFIEMTKTDLEKQFMRIK